MEDEQFLKWIGVFQKDFSYLTCKDKNRTLDYLIEHLDAAQLYHLSIQVEKLLTRDFIVQLPHEVTFHLLSFLDTNTLLKCCSVSKSWNRVIGECQHVWKRACYQAGLNLSKHQSSNDSLKSTYLQKKRILNRLQNGSLFSNMELFGHMDRIMAVHYSNGVLATGSDDHTVRLWACDTGECTHVLRTHSVADLKLCGGRVFTASFDTTAACWDIQTGQAVTRYLGHVGAVFSVDLMECLDVLVTGSADSTVKLWSLTSGQLLRTLTQHRSAWITHVFLFYQESSPHDVNYESSSKSCQGTTTSTSNNAPSDAINVLSDFKVLEQQQQEPQSTSTKHDCGDAISKANTTQNPHQTNTKQYFILSQDNMSLHLWEVSVQEGKHVVHSSEEWQNNTGLALLPGLCKHSQGLGFSIAFVDGSSVHLYECVAGMGSGESPSTGFSLNAIKKLRECTIPEGMSPQTFLASGELFDVLLVDRVELGMEKGPRLLMLHTRNKEMHASVSLPSNYRPSKRGSTMTVCGRGWLSDLPCGADQERAVFVVTMKDNRVYLVHFSNTLDTDDF